MPVIHKFTLNKYMHKQAVRMPVGARILHADAQSGDISVWAEVVASEHYVLRHFRVYTTGNVIAPEDRDSKHVSTIIFDQGGFVVHLYDKGEDAS